MVRLVLNFGLAWSLWEFIIDTVYMIICHRHRLAVLWNLKSIFVGMTQKVSGWLIVYICFFIFILIPTNMLSHLFSNWDWGTMHVYLMGLQEFLMMIVYVFVHTSIRQSQYSLCNCCFFSTQLFMLSLHRRKLTWDCSQWMFNAPVFLTPLICWT